MASTPQQQWKLTKLGDKWAKDNDVCNGSSAMQQLCTMSDLNIGRSRTWYIACLDESIKWNIKEAKGNKATPFYRTAFLHGEMRNKLNELIEEAVAKKYLSQ